MEEDPVSAGFAYLVLFVIRYYISKWTGLLAVFWWCVRPWTVVSAIVAVFLYIGACESNCVRTNIYFVHMITSRFGAGYEADSSAKKEKGQSDGLNPDMADMSSLLQRQGPSDAPKV